MSEWPEGLARGKQSEDCAAQNQRCSMAPDEPRDPGTRRSEKAVKEADCTLRGEDRHR
jgi:hypothetical protein